MIERLISDAIQELKRIRIEEGPSDENRKAQWYLNQVIEILNPSDTEPFVETNSPDVPAVAEETTVGKQEDEPSEEGTVSPKEGTETEGAESVSTEEDSTPKTISEESVTGTVTGIFKNDPSGN